MISIDKAKDKIRKLLALSKSSNVYEAALAMDMAHKLMATFGFTENDLHDFVNTPFIKKNNFPRYCEIIAVAVSRLYMVLLVRTDKKRVVEFIGEKLYVNIAIEMYNYLISVINRAAEKAKMKNGGSLVGKSSVNNFKMGMALELHKRIEKESSNVSWAPERPKMKFLVKSWYTENCLAKNENIRYSSTKLYCGSDGYYEGIAAAKNTSLNRQCSGLNKQHLSIEQK
jgi:hypothetical protein